MFSESLRAISAFQTRNSLRIELSISFSSGRHLKSSFQQTLWTRKKNTMKPTLLKRIAEICFSYQMESFQLAGGTPVESATATILGFWRVHSLGNLILSLVVPVISLKFLSRMFYSDFCLFFFVECSLLHLPTCPFYDLMIQTKTQLLAWYRWNKKRKCLYSVRLYSRWSIRSVQTATSLLNTLLQDPSMFGWDTRRKSWEKWKKKEKKLKKKRRKTSPTWSGTLGSSTALFNDGQF